MQLLPMRLMRSSKTVEWVRRRWLPILEVAKTSSPWLLSKLHMGLLDKEPANDGLRIF